jgi:hypothetical protein
MIESGVEVFCRCGKYAMNRNAEPSILDYKEKSRRGVCRTSRNFFNGRPASK